MHHNEEVLVVGLRDGFLRLEDLVQLQVLGVVDPLEVPQVLLLPG